MMRCVGFEREEAAEEWARNKLKLEEKPEFFRAMAAVDKDENFVCVVVFTNFTSRNVDVNIAMETKKMRPKGTIIMFNDVFSFVFDKLHIKRVTGLTAGKNAKARNIIEHFGFKLEGIMREALPNDDLHVYGFLADEYNNHAWRRG